MFVTQEMHVHNLHASCKAYVKLLSLTDILFMSYFVFVSWTDFTPVESVYWLNIVFPNYILFTHLCRVHLE